MVRNKPGGLVACGDENGLLSYRSPDLQQPLQQLLRLFAPRAEPELSAGIFRIEGKGVGMEMGVINHNAQPSQAACNCQRSVVGRGKHQYRRGRICNHS